MLLRHSIILIGLLLIFPVITRAQLIETENFEFGLSPDIWYNSVDRLQVGVMGGMREPGRIQEGPHHVDFGVLLGTRYPDITLHYRLNYQFNILELAESEVLSGNIRTYRRDGFQQHGAGISWSRPADDARKVWTVNARFYAHELYDDHYQLYDHLWSEGWTDMIRLSARLTDWRDFHRNSSISVDARISPGTLDTDGFARIEGTGQHRFGFTQSIGLNARAYAGWVSADAPSPYHLSFAGASVIDLQDSRFTRARGTLPPSWSEGGFLHNSGGANLRGFMQREAEHRSALIQGNIAESQELPLAPVTESIVALNSELDFPNPLNKWLRSFPVVGEFIKFSSYLFNDTGVIFTSEENPLSDAFDSTFWLMNAGAGFELSLNIPDYLGRKRGFQLRFDLPFWIYDSNINESQFELRPILGLGSIYNF